MLRGSVVHSGTSVSVTVICGVRGAGSRSRRRGRERRERGAHFAVGRVRCAQIHIISASGLTFTFSARPRGARRALLTPEAERGADSGHISVKRTRMSLVWTDRHVARAGASSCSPRRRSRRRYSHSQSRCQRRMPHFTNLREGSETEFGVWCRPRASCSFNEFLPAQRAETSALHHGARQPARGVSSEI